jgi:hypothetical protein
MMNNALSGNYKRKNQLLMKLMKRSIQTPKKVSNGPRGIMDIQLEIQELRMLLRLGSSFQPILVKIPTITSTIWILS